MACQESVEIMADGTRVPRYKNLIGGKISHKPRLLMQWGRWVCISHNARGEGRDDTMAGRFEAWHKWRVQMKRNEQRERRIAQHKAVRPWLWDRT